MGELLQTLRAIGISIWIDGDHLIARPGRLLTDSHRAALLLHKAELLRLPWRLLDAIDRCCAARGDSEANRTALIVECSAYPAWEQSDLLAHFTAEAQRWQAATGCDSQYEQHFAAPARAVSSSVAGNKEL